MSGDWIFKKGQIVALVAMLLLGFAAGAQAKIDGLDLTGSASAVVNLTAKADFATSGDGASMLIWGYAEPGKRAQYPGSTLIVDQGATVTINLTNSLAAEPVSMVFPGHKVTATGGTAGVLTREAAPNGGTVTYRFVAENPGTYTYYSGTHTDLQVEMGLFGAIIVRPSGFDPANPTAYGDARSAYDYEVLFLLSEMDPEIHNLVAGGNLAMVDMTTRWPTVWFINGRTGPDTLAPAFAKWLPTQPYNCLPRAMAGERILIRFVGGGSDLHPLHTHGNNFYQIARDGRLLSTDPANAAAAVTVEDAGLVPDLYVSDFTQTVAPGATYDAVYAWTGRNLGWDIFGPVDTTCVDTAPEDGLDDSTGMHCHDNSFTDVNPADGYDDYTHEFIADHGKGLPVTLPDVKDLTLGQFFSGSPYLGSTEPLPPGEGGFNLNSGLFFMWHSHNEKELTSNDIFPGGMLTMFIVEPPGTTGIE